jgi:hypothetical protein
VRPRQQPNRKFEQRSTPSMVVVGGLLLIAFVVGLVLWVTMGSDDPGGFSPAITSLPDTSEVVVSTPPAAGIVAVHTFDPDGDQQERDDLTPLATDHDLSTAWTTVCYSSKYLGGKQGVGLVADLGSARTGTLTVVIGSAPYQLKVFAAPDGTQPSTFEGWGTAVDSFAGQTPETVTVQITEATRFVLMSFNELGSGNGCTDNPYRGSIKEFSFS